jgi:hypothetical protein
VPVLRIDSVRSVVQYYTNELLQEAVLDEIEV